MKQNNLFISRLTVLGASVFLHSYYGFVQDFMDVNSIITVLWGVVNLGLVYRLFAAFPGLKRQRNR